MVYSNTLQKIKLFSILIILFFVFPIFTAEANVNAEQFSCYTYDAQNHIIDGYWDDEDETWYLFLTSSQSVTESMLYFTGNAVDVSNGTLDSEASTVKEAFRKNGDEITLTLEDGSVHHIVALQSKLPSVYIDLNDTTLDKIHEDKDKKHKNNSIYITDPDGVYDLTIEDSVEIKGRGNSTWTFFDKKAYQIKFEDKTSLFGMGKAKKWILLANAADDSMMRSQLVYQAAQNMDMDFVTSFEYIDLWIEGDYRGTYMLGEKVEPGSSRLNLSNDAGVLFEHDEGFYMEEDYWFYSKVLDKHFVLKEIVEEEDSIITAAMNDFEDSVDELALYLFSTPSNNVTLEKLSTMIDVDSFAKYYLLNEYPLNTESFVSSFYWYKDGINDVLHLGPIWDFDTCVGNDKRSYAEYYGKDHILFQYLLAAPEFYQRLQELTEFYRADLENMVENADILKAQIIDSAEMNYIRWNVLGEPNPRGGSDFHQSFEEAVDTVKIWLMSRATIFTIPQTSVIHTTLSSNCSEMEILLPNQSIYNNVIFAVWSNENGQDDLHWYNGYQNDDGLWYCVVDLKNHNSAGIYHIRAYSDESNMSVATGCSYVETAQTHKYKLDVSISDDYESFNIVLENDGGWDRILFAVWNNENGQDDLIWYVANQNGDLWESHINFMDHETDGQIHVHAYYEADGIVTFLDNRNFDCVEVSQIKKQRVPMLRYYNPNSGEHFYTGSQEEGNVLSIAGWHYEGIAWNAPAVGLPIYRVYNAVAGDHHYTGSMEEVNHLVANGWNYEGISWSTPAAGVPVYRLYNPNAYTGCHHYTPSEEERDHLVDLGWHYEGIAWNGAVV